LQLLMTRKSPALQRNPAEAQAAEQLLPAAPAPDERRGESAAEMQKAAAPAHL
jgi:hypothetical protein